MRIQLAAVCLLMGSSAWGGVVDSGAFGVDAILFDFEEFDHGTVLTDQYESYGVLFQDVRVVFSNFAVSGTKQIDSYPDDHINPIRIVFS